MNVFRYGLRRVFHKVDFDQEATVKFNINLGSASINCHIGLDLVTPLPYIYAPKTSLSGGQQVQLEHRHHGDGNKSPYEPKFVDVCCTYSENVVTNDSADKCLNGLAKDNIMLGKLTTAVDLSCCIIGAVYGSYILYNLADELLYVHDVTKNKIFQSPEITIVTRPSFTIDRTEFLSKSVRRNVDWDRLSDNNCFHWMVKAWGQPDPKMRFLSFFIPIEILLQGTGVSNLLNGSLAEKIIHMIDQSSVENKDALISYTKNSARPSLNQRFTEYATNCAIDGFEDDIKNFKKMNNLRNLLLHQGKPLSSRHRVQNEDMDIIRGLSEKYVYFHLLGRQND